MSNSPTVPPSLGSPLVTVGIPAYNQPALLRETLRSLANQERRDAFEVLVCDDLGLPETAAVVEASGLPSIRLVGPDGTPGAVANWNRCLDLARTPWVTVLHEDDLLLPWFFTVTLPLLTPGRTAIAVRCATGPEPATETRPSGVSPLREYPTRHFLKSAMTPFPGVVVDRAVALRIGGFDHRQGPLADYDFWYRLAKEGNVVVAQTIAAFYRVRDDQWTARAWPEMIRKTHLLRLRIAREQFPHQPALGRWLARFFTQRNALAYARRFPERPASLRRALSLRRQPLAALPSGWVWSLLKSLPR